MSNNTDELAESRLAVIPARGGSKRVPHKNIREFHGRPMLSWVIQEVLLSGCFGRVIVSTDCKEIASVASEAGADVPFIRPSEIAGDSAPLASVIDHVESFYKNSNLRTIGMFFPTAVFLRAAEIIDAVNYFERNPHMDELIPVAKFPVPLEWSYGYDKNTAILNPRFPDSLSTRSQDLKDSYYETAEFVFYKFGHRVMSRPSKGGYLIERFCMDIDTEADWLAAEDMFMLDGRFNKGLGS